MKKIESMAWPSLYFLHGLGFLLLLGLSLGLGRRKEYAAVMILFATGWMVFVMVRKWQAASLPDSLQLVDWLFIAFLMLILLSFTAQGWDKPWVQANARFIPFYMVAPYVCGRFMQVQDMPLFSRGLAVTLCLTLAVFMLAFLSVEDSYLKYRPQIAGTDEVAARVAHLVAQACIVTIFLQLNSLNAARFRVALRYALLLTGLTVLLIFMGLRALLLISMCVVAVGCIKSVWASISRRALLGIVYALVVASSYALMYQTSALANKNGREIVGAVVKLAETGAPDACSENLRKYNSVAIRLELFRDAFQQFRSSPILGVGAGAFGQQSCWSSLVAHPHNILIQVICEIGLIGGTILGSIFVLAAYPQLSSTWRQYDVKNLAFLFFFFELLNSLGSGNYFTSVELWWSLGLIVSMNSKVAGAYPPATTQAS